MKFDKITALQTVNACSREIKLFSLANALTFLLTLENNVSMCLLNVNLLSISTPRSLTRPAVGILSSSM